MTKYRVKFSFWSGGGAYYFTEWFDTLEEAEYFMNRAFYNAAVDVHHIEDDEGNVV